jgi:hypothetical protein
LLDFRRRGDLIMQLFQGFLMLLGISFKQRYYNGHTMWPAPVLGPPNHHANAKNYTQLKNSDFPKPKKECPFFLKGHPWNLHKLRDKLLEFIFINF